VRQRHASGYEQRLLLMAISLWVRCPWASALHRHLATSLGAMARREQERALERLLRNAARHSFSAAPPSFTAATRLTLAGVTIAPAPSRTSVPASLDRRLIATFGARYGHLTEQQRRAALRKAGTLAVALVCGGLGLALDPAEVFTALGLASALILSALALGHLLAAAVGAVMGSAAVALAAFMLYAVLAMLWVRLVRHPIEA
jgi:hypothetical protein